MAELADPLMGAMVDEESPTKQFSKQHQVWISESEENEIDKITKGVIPEFRELCEVGCRCGVRGK